MKDLNRPGKITGTPPTAEQQAAAQRFAVAVLTAVDLFTQQTGKAPMIEIHPDDIELYLKALSGYHPASSNHPGDWVFPSLNLHGGASVFGHPVVAKDTGQRGVIRLSIPILVDDDV